MKVSGPHFCFVILLSIVLGFLWPTPGNVIKPYVAPLLMLMMGLSCLKMDLSSFRDLKASWWRYAIILALVFVLPAAIIFLFKGLLGKYIFIGLLLAAAAPAGISTVFTSDILGGEPPKALLATTLAHLVSPVVMPFIVWLFGRTVIEVDFLAMARLIAQFVLVPFAAAQAVRLTGWHEKFAPYVSITNLYLLVIIIWGVIGPARNLIVQNYQSALVALAIAALVMAAEVAIAIWFGRTKAEDITWSIVNTYKNYVLASVLALALFGPPAAIGVIMYSIADNLVLIPLSLWSNKK